MEGQQDGLEQTRGSTDSGGDLLHSEKLGYGHLDTLRDTIAERLQCLSLKEQAAWSHHRPTALDELEEDDLLELYVDAILLETEEEFVALIEEIFQIRGCADRFPMDKIEARLDVRLRRGYRA
ncbi:hypothetical protein [Gorillibacterium sp. sgz5001074]|uniref:hypothetical protein n=1 Tax=Gorillibacterium sp. sgz5001074 TaxID=3446695 RepID=UPI003F66FF45